MHGAVYQAHDARYEADETACDGLDNDCDGATDEAPGCTCVPACSGKQCGPDGCGGACGTCPAGHTCESGTCAPTSKCGQDPSRTCQGRCGGQGLGSCMCDAYCAMYQNCCPDLLDCCGTCIPNCQGKQCGPDGCGGACGTCQAGQTCQNGACVSASECGKNPNLTCKNSCGGQGVGGCYCDSVCASKGDCCPDKAACCGTCVPNCQGKECGLDGCGGSCGGCPESDVCSPEGQCVDYPPIEEFGKSCDTTADCYPGLVCRDILAQGVKVCTMGCTGIFGQGTCPPGWMCFPTDLSLTGVCLAIGR